MDTPELENVLAAQGTRSNRLVVQLGEYEGSRILNVRRWYVDAKTGAWIPTRKGITLGREAHSFVLKTLRDHEHTIADWLTADGGESAQVRASRNSQAESAHHATFTARAFEVRSEDWESPAFFRLDGSGGKDILVINTASEVGRALLRNTNGQAILYSLLVAHGRACRLADGGDNGATADLLELLSVNWSFVMNQYLTTLES